MSITVPTIPKRARFEPEHDDYRESFTRFVEADTAWTRQSCSSTTKVPRDVFFVDELPHNPTGKVLKRELRGGQV